MARMTSAISPAAIPWPAGPTIWAAVIAPVTVAGDAGHAGVPAGPFVYRTLKEGLLYHDVGAAVYDAQHRTRVLRRLRQRAATLGFALVNRDTGEVLEGAVS
jgi:hypothetical protein